MESNLLCFSCEKRKRKLDSATALVVENQMNEILIPPWGECWDLFGCLRRISKMFLKLISLTFCRKCIEEDDASLT